MSTPRCCLPAPILGRAEGPLPLRSYGEREPKKPEKWCYLKSFFRFFTNTLKVFCFRRNKLKSLCEKVYRSDLRIGVRKVLQVCDVQGDLHYSVR